MRKSAPCFLRKLTAILVLFFYSFSARCCNLLADEVNYFHADHIHSSNIVTDSSGNQTALYEYDPYGRVVTHTGPIDVKHRFTGQEADDSTNLYYYNARYYDPQLGRFITPDWYVQDSGDSQSFNRYSYARNNPLVYNDPTGNFFFIPFLIAAAAFVAAHAAEIAAVALALTAASIITKAAGANGVSKGLGIAAIAIGAISTAGGAAAAELGAKGGASFVEQVSYTSFEKITTTLGDGVIATTYVPHTVTVTVINTSLVSSSQALTAGLTAAAAVTSMVKTLDPNSLSTKMHMSDNNGSIDSQSEVRDTKNNADLPINRQKQDGHVKGTPQYKNRVKQGKPTSSFPNKETADRLTNEAWEKGEEVIRRPDGSSVREYDFKSPVGEGPRGGAQERVRVHRDSEGQAHGHPSGPENKT